MEQEFDFKKIYAGANNAPTPDINDLVKKASRLKNKKLIELSMTNLLLVSTGIYISKIYMKAGPRFITSNIGIIFIIAAILLYVIVSNRFLPVLFKTNTTQGSSKYLKDFLALRTRQRFLHTTIMNVSFGLFAIGICLAMMEPALQMANYQAIFTYLFTLAWIAFSWFYLRPRTIKKQQNNLDEIIANIERINQQLKE